MERNTVDETYICTFYKRFMFHLGTCSSANLFSKQDKFRELISQREKLKAMT